MKLRTLEIGQKLHHVFMHLATHALASGDVHLFQLYFNICNTIYDTITPKPKPTPA